MRKPNTFRPDASFKFLGNQIEEMGLALHPGEWPDYSYALFSEECEMLRIMAATDVSIDSFEQGIFEWLEWRGFLTDEKPKRYWQSLLFRARSVLVGGAREGVPPESTELATTGEQVDDQQIVFKVLSNKFSQYDVDATAKNRLRGYREHSETMEIINSVKSLVRRLLYNSIVPSWHLDEEGLLTPIPPNVWGTPEGLAAIDSSLELSLTLTNDNGESRQVQVYPMVKDGALLDAFRSEKEGRPPMRTVGNVITIVKDYVSGVQSKVDQLGLSDDDPQDDVCPPGDSTGALEKLERPKVSARQLLTAVIERWPTDHANPKTEFLRLLVRKHCGMTRGPYTSLRKEMLENGTMPSDWTNPGKRLLPELSDDKVDGLIAEILDELTSHH